MADILGTDGRIVAQVAIIGAGVAGTPTGGVLTVQGIAPDGALLLGTIAEIGDGIPFMMSSENVGGTIASLNVIARLSPDGVLTDVPRTAHIFKPQSAVAIAAEATIWTPTAGKKFRLMGGSVASSVVGNVTLRDNTAGTIIAMVPCGVAGVAYPIFGPNAGNGILSAVANNVLTATGPALATLSGTVFGTEE